MQSAVIQDIGMPAPFNLYGIMQQRLNVHVHLIVPQARVKVKSGVGLPASVLIVGDEKFCSLAREKRENKVLQILTNNCYVRITHCAEKLPQSGIVKHKRRGSGDIKLVPCISLMLYNKPETQQQICKHGYGQVEKETDF